MIFNEKFNFQIKIACANYPQVRCEAETRIVRESDYSPASQLFLQGEKNNDR